MEKMAKFSIFRMVKMESLSLFSIIEQGMMEKCARF